MLIHLVAYGQPVSAKNNKRAFVNQTTHRAHIVLSEAILAWYAEQVPILREQFARHDLPTITRFVHIETHQYLRDEVLAQRSPDGDNAMSACWDALVKAGVLKDDKLCISWGGTRRHDPHRPRVEIEIHVLGSLPLLPSRGTS